jgi:DNA ligase-1
VIEFARTCDEIAALAGKLAKIARVAAYFVTLDDDGLRSVARFLTGNPLAARDTRKLAIGASTLVAAARRVWAPEEAELSAAFRATGDLGDALARIVREPAAPTLLRETLTPAGFARLLDELASAAGPSAGKRRQALCERAFRACREPREVAYVAKILTGDLRIGLREGLVLDAIAAAFERDPAAVRRAAAAAGDIGEVAVRARADTLAEVAIHYGAPLGFMLATPLAFGSPYRELDQGIWLAEDKYDGIRAQAHLQAGRARLFSRTFSDISRAFPEIVAAFEACPGDAIFDGEIVAVREDRVLPFRALQPRLQRVDPSPALRAAIAVSFVAFDLLAAGDAFLLDLPLVERRVAIAGRIVASPALAVAPWTTLAANAGGESVAALFEAARARGNEGLMLKRADAPYVPGRRGKWWLKLKRPLATLDVVVTAVEWGHGKRSDVLSDYTFAVRRSTDDPELLPIGKAYTGLTDEEIAQMTGWFLEHRTGVTAARGAYAVEPRIVIEIAFDVIQESTLHASGFALRFPRIVRLRPDKLPSEIDTLADVERTYAAMLAREDGAR